MRLNLFFIIFTFLLATSCSHYTQLPLNKLNRELASDPPGSIKSCIESLKKAIVTFKQKNDYRENWEAISSELGELIESLKRSAPKQRISQKTLDDISKLQLSLSEMSPENLGLLGLSHYKLKARIKKIKNSSVYKSVFNKKKYFREYKSLYQADLARLSPLNINDFPSVDSFKDTFLYMITLRELGDKSTAFPIFRSDFKFQDFMVFVRSKDDTFFSEGSLSMKESFFKLKNEFSEKALKKKELEPLQIEYRKESLRKYLSFLDKSFEDIYDLNSFQELLVRSVYNYRALDSNFRGNDFLIWLKKNNSITQSELDYLKKRGSNIGYYLKYKYEQFAPYSKSGGKVAPRNLSPNFILKAGQEIGYKGKDIFNFTTQKLKESVRLAKGCKGSIGCYHKVLKKNFTSVFNVRNLSDKLSCLKANPMVAWSSASDLALYTAALMAFYSSTKDNFERFPWEIPASSAVFTWVMGEVNCRSTFKSTFTFGKQIRKEFLTSKYLPTKAYLKPLKKSSRNNIAFNAMLSSASYVLLKYAFDGIFMGMGGQLTNPTVLKDIAIMTPFVFLHNGLWVSLKSDFFYNPVRHKLIPKIARIVEKRLGQKGSSWVYRAGIDGIFYWYLSKYNNWEFLDFYMKSVVPGMMGILGIDHLVNNKHQKEDVDISEGGSQMQATYESDKFKSRVTFKKEKVEGKISYSLKDADLDISDVVLEELINFQIDKMESFKKLQHNTK